MCIRDRTGGGGGVSKLGGSGGGVSNPVGSGGGDSLSSKSSSIPRPTSSSVSSKLKPGGGGGGGIGGIPGGGGGVSDMADAPSEVGLDVHWIGLTIARPQSYGLNQNTNG